MEDGEDIEQVKEAGRQQLWQQQSEKRQGGESRSEGAEQKAENAKGGGSGGLRRRRAASTQKTPGVRLGCSIRIHSRSRSFLVVNGKRPVFYSFSQKGSPSHTHTLIKQGLAAMLDANLKRNLTFY